MVDWQASKITTSEVIKLTKTREKKEGHNPNMITLIWFSRDRNPTEYRPKIKTRRGRRGYKNIDGLTNIVVRLFRASRRFVFLSKNWSKLLSNEMNHKVV